MIQLNAQTVSGGTYSWSGPYGFTSQLQNPVLYNATYSNSGDYYLYVQSGTCQSLPTKINVTVNSCQKTDLGITKSLNNYYPTTGQIIEFTLTATNYGNDDASDVVVNDLIPSGFSFLSSSASKGSYNPSTGIWLIDTLKSGGSEVLTIQANVNSLGNYVNVATITSNNSEFYDSNLANNIASVEAFPGDFNIPNAFSPNGDGINEVFRIQGLKAQSSLTIFNRFGKLIYQSENYNNDWNGTDSDGNILESDTYWYVLVMPGFPVAFKGFVYLKR